MKVLIADTFTDSLARLTGDEQKAVKTTAFDLQLNPANPGMQLHKLDKARDKNFWSVRVNVDIRLIVHRTDEGLLLCYVDHHDAAYSWAERRKLETHPKTGAAQLVELRETVKEIVVPRYVEQEQPRPRVTPKPLFADLSEETLLGYGVPAEWMDDVHVATEDSIFSLADYLPAEAAEALLELATGGRPRVAVAAAVASPFEHPDALRRFRVMASMEELARAFDYPWDKWTVFLHPEQRQLVEQDYAGPARVAGSAGTGKTIVALHRAAYLARANPDARVLLTTFSDALACLADAAQPAGEQRAAIGGTHRCVFPERIGHDCTRCTSVRCRWPIGRRSLICCRRRRRTLAVTSSADTSCSPNGSRSWTPGNWTAGKHIATSHGWAARPDCRRRNGGSCGRFSKKCIGAGRAELHHRGEHVHPLASISRAAGSPRLNLRWWTRPRT